MKIINKILLLLVSVLSLQISYSQPVFTSSINLSVGDSYRYNGYNNVTNADPGFSGKGQVWNFAAITGTLTIIGKTQVCTLPSLTPFADSAAVAGADICVVGVDSTSTNYQYFVNGNSSQILAAMGSVTTKNNAFYGDYKAGIVQFKFPFAYANSFNYSFEVQYYDVAKNYYYFRDSSVVTIEADGYGMVTTPARTWENVLRIKKTQHQFLWMKSQAGENWTFIGTHLVNEYRWMAPGVKLPVMFLMNYDGADEYTAHYLVEYNFTTGVDEKYTGEVEIYPNPVTDRLTISSDKLFNNIRLFSVNGRLLEDSKTNLVKNKTVDFSDFKEGVYFLEIDFNDGNTISKKIIK